MWYDVIMSGALDKSLFDESTFLLEITEENGRQRYVFFGGDMICSLLTNVNIYNYISSMGNNLTPYCIAIDEENIFFWLHISSLLKMIGLMIENYWIQMKSVLIRLIIIFQFFERNQLKNYENINSIEIMIIKNSYNYIFLFYLNGNSKWYLNFL